MRLFDTMTHERLWIVYLPIIAWTLIGVLAIQWVG